jgi:hypothetical protein
LLFLLQTGLLPNNLIIKFFGGVVILHPDKKRKYPDRKKKMHA